MAFSANALIEDVCFVLQVKVIAAVDLIELQEQVAAKTDGAGEHVFYLVIYNITLDVVYTFALLFYDFASQ